MVVAPPAELLPPHNLAAERAVLGCALLEPGALARLTSELTAADFFSSRHRILWTRLVEMREAGHGIDLVTLEHALATAGELEEIGGAAYLALIVDEAAVTGLLSEYVRIVAECAGKRDVLHFAMELAGQASNGQPLSEVVSGAARSLEKLKGRSLATSSVQSLGMVLRGALESLQAGRREFIRAPFGDLNRLLYGGFLAGELVYLGARPGTGKSALMLEMATQTGRAGHGVLVISREMQNEALGLRILAQNSEVSAGALRAGNLTDGELQELRHALYRLYKLPVYFDDRVGSIGQIEALVAAEVERAHLKLLVLDYLQLLRGQKGLDRRQEIEDISKRLKLLAVEHGLVVVCLSSLSRPEKGQGGKKPRPPSLADLRESGALEHDADIVLLLHRPPATPTNPYPLTDVLVPKARSASSGGFQVQFRGDSLTFREVAKEREPGDESEVMEPSL